MPEPKSVIITYTQEDLEYALRIAAKRNDPKEQNKIRSKKFDPNKTELQAHEDGIHGELGFSLWSYLPIREDYSLGGEGSYRYDFRLPNNETVEVRFRTKQWHEFALNDDRLESFVTDWGVLVKPGPRPYTLALKGCIHRDEFAKKCKRMTLRGARLVLPNENLSSMSLIADILNRGYGALVV